MEVFQKYAQFYDFLYQDKDYQKECLYLQKIFKKYGKRKIKTILDLGCGTGNHDLILNKLGFKITGIDQSKEMISQAKDKAKKVDAKIIFYQKDIRKFFLNKKFDALISMFAVIGYLNKNEDLEKGLRNAFYHLKKGGLFVFDVWFGPAVLADKPKAKIKRVKIKNGKIIRKTKCKFDLLKQITAITFETKKYVKNKIVSQAKETHLMRFFFPQEINYFLTKSGFQLLALHPFLTFEKLIDEQDWNIIVVAEKKKD